MSYPFTGRHGVGRILLSAWHIFKPSHLHIGWTFGGALAHSLYIACMHWLKHQVQGGRIHGPPEIGRVRPGFSTLWPCEALIRTPKDTR